MKLLDDLKHLISRKLKRRGKDNEDGAEPVLVGARLKPQPRPGASSIALPEPD
jgi:hypothetical protein